MSTAGGGVDEASLLVLVDVDESEGTAGASFASVLPLGACFLPALRVAKYWQGFPRLAHREHVGFSLLQRSLEEAQAWQLSLSFTATALPEDFDVTVEDMTAALAYGEGEGQVNLYLKRLVIVRWPRSFCCLPSLLMADIICAEEAAC